MTELCNTVRILRIGAQVCVGAAMLLGSTYGQVRAQGNGGTGPSFTAAQAAAGKMEYGQYCRSCHGENLDDGEFAPELKGTHFRQQWGGKSTDLVFAYIGSKMPPENPGKLGDQVYAEILAFVLQSNGVRPGNRELPVDVNALKAMMLPSAAPGAGGGLSPGVGLPPFPKSTNPLDRITPVTDEMLQNPLPSEWLTWRRGFDYQGFSPLRQINKKNVSDLRIAWTWSLPLGPNEATPLEHDGVLFVYSSGDKVQALDAVTGNLLWEYSRKLPRDVRATVKRDISIYGDKLYVGTSDVHVVALDVKTGKVVWDEAIADVKDGFSLTGGPLVAKGKVMVGTVGRVPGGNYIVAFDASTGKEAWRFNTIAQPGEPGGNSWNGLPFEKRNGASAWIAGSYDPVLNLTYWGVAQTYDTGPLLHAVNQPGITNDALYTDSTLALNPDTGKLVWYFQHQPNDQWDLDWVFERHLIKLPINGTMKQLVVTGGKQAIYEGLEADTGKYVFSIDLGLQNIVTAIDPKTGAKTIDPKTVPGDGEAKMVCPHAGGAKNWLPASYNPETKILYTPLIEACMDLSPVAPGERGSLSTGVRWTIRPRPEGDGKYGRLEAVNLETRKVVWIDRQRAPQTSGALATAGGLIFNGSVDRFLRAHDDATGKVLWEVRLPDFPSSAPITYRVDGKQYLAVVISAGGSQNSSFLPFVPEISIPTDRGSALWVFELPGKGVTKESLSR